MRQFFGNIQNLIAGKQWRWWPRLCHIPDEVQYSHSFLPAPVVLVIIVVAGEPGWASSSADENFSTVFRPEVKGSPVVKPLSKIEIPCKKFSQSTTALLLISSQILTLFGNDPNTIQFLKYYADKLWRVKNESPALRRVWHRVIIDRFYILHSDYNLALIHILRV